MKKLSVRFSGSELDKSTWIETKLPVLTTLLYFAFASEVSEYCTRPSLETIDTEEKCTRENGNCENRIIDDKHAEEKKKKSILLR